MEFQKNLLKAFQDTSHLASRRYESSQSVFMYMSFVFFLNYLLVWGSPYVIFLKTLPFTYSAFIASFFLMVYLLIEKYFPNKRLKIITIPLVVGMFALCFVAFFKLY